MGGERGQYVVYNLCVRPHDARAATRGGAALPCGCAGGGRGQAAPPRRNSGPRGTGRTRDALVIRLLKHEFCMYVEEECRRSDRGGFIDLSSTVTGGTRAFRSNTTHETINDVHVGPTGGG